MHETITRDNLVKVHKTLFEIPASFNASMRVPARVFTSEAMLEEVLSDRSLWQLTNVATLAGIQKAALAMPDIHEGYGFPIGGVAAMALDQGGVISPGGIGYDINCGVRLLSLNYTTQDIQPFLNKLAHRFFEDVPSGVGRGGLLKLKDSELNKILGKGAPYMLKLGFGEQQDIDYCEENGALLQADPDLVSDKARNRGRDQLGTLGSGNHFLEIQKVEKIYDAPIAQVFGLELGMVTIMIHCGSRGLGHQTCSDYVSDFLPRLESWKIVLPDPELACAPFHSPEGQNYFKAMCAAANFAWANRHLIGHKVRLACTDILGSSVRVRTIYDISHNIGKKEKHIINEKDRELIVHRKGATRAFSAGNPAIISPYRAVGHPVLIPGTMGTASYVLVGTPEGMTEAFGSSCHGAGRRMSRARAKKSVRGSHLRKELEEKGIVIVSDSDPGLAEEAPLAYKDVDEVVHVTEEAGLARPVARLVPLAVVKGG